MNKKTIILMLFPILILFVLGIGATYAAYHSGYKEGYKVGSKQGHIIGYFEGYLKSWTDRMIPKKDKE